MDFRIMGRQQPPPVAHVAPNIISNSDSNFNATFSQSLVLSDEESLEDHSGLEDFQGVTLQMNETPTPGTPFCLDDAPSADVEKKYNEERAALLQLQSCDNQVQYQNMKNNTANRSPTPSSGVPRISITPMTPPSGSASPDGHSTISLSSSTRGSPMYSRGHGHGHGHDHGHGHGHGKHSHGFGGSSESNSNFENMNNYWRCQSPMPPTNEFEAREFFAYRDTIIQNVIDEVQSLAEPSLDGDVRGTWLLTEIDHWDNEKERIILLCTKSMVIVKYDFIAMKQEDHRRVFLCIVDKIIQGELKYPQRSLTPRLGGIAGGLVSVVKGCIFPRVTGTVQSVGSAILFRTKKQDSTPSKEKDTNNQSQSETEKLLANEVCPAPPNSFDDTFQQQPPPPPPPEADNPKTSIMSALALENFEPRDRNVQGIRIMWNQDLPLSFTQKWNPFNKSIPWMTFASHPLLWHKGGGGGINRSFDIDTFSREFLDILTHSGGDCSPMCRVEYKPIIIETYIGLTSLFHNANGLGFYKVRGRVSF